MAQPKDAGERLKALADALAESVADAPDVALLEEAKIEGRDPKQTQSDVQRLLSSTLLAFKRHRLAQAADEYLEATAALKKQRVALPNDPSLRRTLLNTVLAREPQLKQETLQFRDFDELTDEDVASILQKLGHLGLLDKE